MRGGLCLGSERQKERQIDWKEGKVRASKIGIENVVDLHYMHTGISLFCQSIDGVLYGGERCMLWPLLMVSENTQ